MLGATGARLVARAVVGAVVHAIARAGAVVRGGDRRQRDPPRRRSERRLQVAQRRGVAGRNGGERVRRARGDGLEELALQRRTARAGREEASAARAAGGASGVAVVRGPGALGREAQDDRAIGEPRVVQGGVEGVGDAVEIGRRERVRRDAGEPRFVERPRDGARQPGSIRDAGEAAEQPVLREPVEVRAQRASMASGLAGTRPRSASAGIASAAARRPRVSRCQPKVARRPRIDARASSLTASTEAPTRSTRSAGAGGAASPRPDRGGRRRWGR